MTIGKKIYVARKGADMTQKELASKLGISAVNISQIENGKRIPTLDTISRIAEALSMDIHDLIAFDNREYENLTETLRSAGLVIEPTGFSDGPGEYNDLFYVWDEDAENPEEERVELTYGNLLRIVREAEASADRKRTEYLRSRLLLDLF